VKPAPFRYRRTTTVDETVAALAGGRARVLAGGQSLVAELCARTTSAEVLVDIAGVTELDHVALAADVVRIGALRRLAALEDDAELAAALPALVECAGRIAHPAVRNRGTVGGNVAHADPASGVPPVLLAHDGEVVGATRST
jgi:aerobic carbon-monoxide dehydrogenase medium subunit